MKRFAFFSQYMVAMVLGAAAVVAACGNEAGVLVHHSSTTSDDAGATSDGGLFGDITTNVSGTGAGTGGNTGLPCDVQQLLENRCVGCHVGTSPPPLLTYGNLVSVIRPGTTMAQQCVLRMQSTTSPMPPPPAEAPTADEVATFAAWVDAGTPRAAACTGADGGVTTTTFNTPTVCTSGQTWNGDTSSQMDPGQACITCHLRNGPKFTIAGTVYPSAHEPNNCYGVQSTTLHVVVTDANGVDTSLAVNATGNFSSSRAVAPPFHVKVVDGTKTRTMSSSLTAGDCNSCHTEQGANGAPGRVVAP